MADKILTSRSAIEGERKLVTVMFADVTGFTSMSEKLDPEDVHQIMNGCFSILMDEVHKCEGTVNEFRGDGVMALFGAPIAHEDHAQRACCAALAIQKGLVPYGEKLKKDYGIDFKMRIGLNSGPVVVGAIGDDLRMDYTAQGDTANLAARMETNAEPGRVLVSANTWKLVKDSFVFEPMEKMKVKGKEHAVSAYRLKDAGARLRLRPEREVYSEMIGRDQELLRLELQVMKAANGEGSVVNVIGEAGIGKSRLLAELKKRDVVKRVNFLEGRAISMGKNLSFHPAINLLKNWARIRDDDAEATAMSKLESAVRRVSSEEVDEIFPFVATMMGMKLSGKHADRVKGIEGESLEKLVFKNVRELLIRSTEIIPIVIVMEDLHWADTSSLLLMDSLYRLALAQKVLFINVFRPGYWLGDYGTVETIKKRIPDLSVVDIVVQPLDTQNSEALINNMLNIRGLHHGVKGQIIERAGGNPFFIEEVVRSLIDEGAVKVTDKGCEVTDRIHSVVIPPNINDVLMARIDRLDEASRNVVKVASVIGRSFFYRILADVAARVEDLQDKLEYLKQIQLIRERTRMQELEYLFNHALAQEAAYESTLIQHRKALHLKVAESIERIFRDSLHEFFGILALHYSKADNLEKAEEYMVKAGEEALRASASSEALHYYQEALRLYRSKYGETADAEKVASLEKNIGLAHFNRGEYEKALVNFDGVLARWGGGHPKSTPLAVAKLIIDLVLIMASLYLPNIRSKKIPSTRVNEFFDLAFKKDLALVHVDPMRELFEQVGELRATLKYDVRQIDIGAVLHLATGALFFYTGFFGIGGILFRHAETLVDEKKTVDVVAHRGMSTVKSFFSGRWHEIEDYDESIVNRGLREGLFWYVIIYAFFHAYVRIHRGQFDAARTCISTLLDVYETHEYHIARSFYFSTEAEWALMSRKLSNARNMAGDDVSVAREQGIDTHLLMALGRKISAVYLSGDTLRALETLNEEEETRKTETFWPPHFLYRPLLARFMFSLGTLEESMLALDELAVTEYRKSAFRCGANAVRNSRAYAPARTEVFGLMGTCYWLLGKQDKALKWFDKSIKEGERLGARPDLSRTYMEVGKRLLEPHSKYRELNGISSKEYLEKARTMFTEMDLQWDLEQLERVRQGM